MKFMKKDLTQGNVTKTMLIFAGPMILGNMLQQCYNIADTFIVGKFIGSGALAAVGAAYTLMTFLTSVIIGLCMGSGAVFSQYFGAKEYEKLKESVSVAFGMIGTISVVLGLGVSLAIVPILRLLQIPDDIYECTKDYVQIIFVGIIFLFLYNYFAFLLRALGNSFVPLCFLGISTILNIALDLLFVIQFQWGVEGAASATVLSQAAAGIGIMIYAWVYEPDVRIERRYLIQKEAAKHILRFSMVSSVQQSVMNFGILMIQGLVNSFGTAVMAAFAAGVKIDSFAYMPAQEFGNAFSLFISQNHGAGEEKRVKQGVNSAIRVSAIFCALISVMVFFFAPQLMQIFIEASEIEIIEIGTQYLRVEGVCYLGIGVLFLLYGYFRAIEKPEMSLILTVISLGTRVLLAYTLAPIKEVGAIGIWIAIPIGWALADFVGLYHMKK